jgi:hypothetical protein
MARWTGAPDADGEVAWSWLPDAGVKFANALSGAAGDGGNKARSPGRSRISRNTIAQGRPDDPGDTCGDYRVLSTTARGPWVRRAPGLPCAF